MIKYKIDVADALDRIGFNAYKAKTTGIISQDTLRKIKNENTDISIKSINAICALLDMQPGNILQYIPDAADQENIVKKFNKNAWLCNFY